MCRVEQGSHGVNILSLRNITSAPVDGSFLEEGEYQQFVQVKCINPLLQGQSANCILVLVMYLALLAIWSLYNFI